jgi:hypothetical protein
MLKVVQFASSLLNHLALGAKFLVMIVFPLKDNAIITFIYTVFSNGLNKDLQKNALYVVKKWVVKN